MRLIPSGWGRKTAGCGDEPIEIFARKCIIPDSDASASSHAGQELPARSAHGYNELFSGKTADPDPRDFITADPGHIGEAAALQKQPLSIDLDRAESLECPDQNIRGQRDREDGDESNGHRRGE